MVPSSRHLYWTTGTSLAAWLSIPWCNPYNTIIPLRPRSEALYVPDTLHGSEIIACPPLWAVLRICAAQTLASSSTLVAQPVCWASTLSEFRVPVVSSISTCSSMAIAAFPQGSSPALDRQSSPSREKEDVLLESNPDNFSILVVALHSNWPL